LTAQTGKPIFDFPEPQVPGLNFSFSGLKTAILYFVKEKTKENPDFLGKNLPDICASVQDRIVSILLNKLQVAVKQTGIREIAIAGGVSANSGLRNALEGLGSKLGWNTYIPRFEFCTDNAAMIAVTGYYKFLAGEFDGQDTAPVARASFE
jgi:N6-L-threonylcarbamoyladenine synthase